MFIWVILSQNSLRVIDTHLQLAHSKPKWLRKPNFMDKLIKCQKIYYDNDEMSIGYAPTPCHTVPCSGKRHTGDVNGDSVFDILDVSVQEKYRAEMYAGFHSVQGIAIIFFLFSFLLTNCCDYRREKWCRNICYW